MRASHREFRTRHIGRGLPVWEKLAPKFVRCPQKHILQKPSVSLIARKTSKPVKEPRSLIHRKQVKLHPTLDPQPYVQKTFLPPEALPNMLALGERERRSFSKSELESARRCKHVELWGDIVGILVIGIVCRFQLMLQVWR